MAILVGNMINIDKPWDFGGILFSDTDTHHIVIDSILISSMVSPISGNTLMPGPIVGKTHKIFSKSLT